MTPEHPSNPVKPGISAEAAAVHGQNPGPASGISVDVIVHYPGGDQFFPGVPLFNPVPPALADFDVYGPLPGSGVGLGWRGNETRFWFDWFPVTTDCQPPGFGAPSPIIDPNLPARRTVLSAVAGAMGPQAPDGGGTAGSSGPPPTNTGGGSGV